MDCNCNQRSAGSCRPQMPPPPCMNTNCGCGSPMPLPPIQPRMGDQGVMPGGSIRPPFDSMPPAGMIPSYGMKPPCDMRPSCGTKPSCDMKPSCGMKPSCDMRPSCDTKPSCNMRPSGTVSPGMVNPAGYQPPAMQCTIETANMPIAMAYVPWQQWRQTYPVDKALSRGTIFPELDLPFVMGRCR